MAEKKNGSTPEASSNKPDNTAVPVVLSEILPQPLTLRAGANA